MSVWTRIAHRWNRLKPERRQALAAQSARNQKHNASVVSRQVMRAQGRRDAMFLINVARPANGHLSTGLAGLVRVETCQRMSVWYAIPSKRPPEQAEPVLRLWCERGYKIALWLDSRTPGVTPPWPIIHGVADRVLDRGHYPGYAAAVNALVRDILEQDPQAEWITTGGDDVEPDANHSAEEIARECSDHFRSHWLSHAQFDMAEKIFKEPQQLSVFETFGVMQPTGDRWVDTGDGFSVSCHSPVSVEFHGIGYSGDGLPN